MEAYGTNTRAEQIALSESRRETSWNWNFGLSAGWLRSSTL